MVSCHPKLTARNRIIVVAELVSEPAEPFERPDYLSQPTFVFAFDEEAIVEALGEDAAKEVLSNDTKENQDEGVSEDKEEKVLSKELTESEPPEIEETSTPQMDAATTQSRQVSGFGEGLSGDRSSIVPSIAWGVALVTLIMTTGFVSRRWRRWPTYFLSLAPIIAVMLVWFFNLDRALPSY